MVKDATMQDGDRAFGHYDVAARLVSQPFNLSTLPDTRAALRRTILAAGVTSDRARAFVFAINEGLINAITHGGGQGTVSLVRAGERLVAVVEDHKPTRPLAFPQMPPPPSAERGRGLWLIAQSCDEARFEVGGRGLRLIMELALGAA
jgi:anti-sigma regulatory factor (Ser/Thr protein kinase)